MDVEVRFPEGEPPGCVMGARKIANSSYGESGQILIEFTRPDGSTGKMKSPTEGIVTFERSCTNGFQPSSGVLLAKIGHCDHAIVIKDLCAACGKDLRRPDGMAGERKESTSAKVSMIHHVPELIVSNELAHKLGSKDQEHVLASRKLILLVDLDQTIIHTTNKPQGKDLENRSDITRYRLYGGDHYTKIRPYTREFLENLSKLYEMHIVTYGQRQYAHKIADIIDPDRKYFGQRVLSRDELFSQHLKTMNLKALFPCGDQLITIIDDRADVWQYSDALVQVKPYRYFQEVGDINAAACGHGDEPKAEMISDDEDRILEHVERVLIDVHTAFYKHYDQTKEIKDLKVIVSYLKSQVLRGLNIVLSGVVPMGEKEHRSEVYRLCTQFGAKFMDTVTKDTTHVVAAKWGTQKVFQAQKLGIPVVTPGWVYYCRDNWMKGDEKEFELNKDTVVASGRESGRVLIKEFGDLPTMAKEDMKTMCDEVDEALGDDDDDEDEEGEEKEDGESEEGAERGDEDGRRESSSKVEVAEIAEKKTKERKRKRCPEAEDMVSDDDLEDKEEEEERVLKKRRGTLEEEDDGDDDDKSDIDYGRESDEDPTEIVTGEVSEGEDERGEEEEDELDDIAADIDQLMEDNEQ